MATDTPAGLGDLTDEARTKAIAAHHAELVHTEKLSALGLMASAVAHEVNNPLGGVMACITALEDGTVPPERAPEYFATVRDALRRIQETVQSLLIYAHPGSAQVTDVDLREIAEGCRRLLVPLANRRDVRLDVQVADAHATVPGDRSALTQALMNVLLNGVQASAPGGAVHLEALSTPDHLGLRVSDRGAGIPAEHLARVTEPFFTTKPEGQGTGLGLHLTARVLADHHGRLTIDSRAGDTRVTLWLPRATPIHDGERI